MQTWVACYQLLFILLFVGGLNSCFPYLFTCRQFHFPVYFISVTFWTVIALAYDQCNVMQQCTDSLNMLTLHFSDYWKYRLSSGFVWKTSRHAAFMFFFSSNDGGVELSFIKYLFSGICFTNPHVNLKHFSNLGWPMDIDINHGQFAMKRNLPNSKFHQQRFVTVPRKYCLIFGYRSHVSRTFAN